MNEEIKNSPLRDSPSSFSLLNSQFSSRVTGRNPHTLVSAPQTSSVYAVSVTAMPGSHLTLLTRCRDDLLFLRHRCVCGFTTNKWMLDASVYPL